VLLTPALLLVFGLRVVPMLVAGGVSFTNMNLARPYDPTRYVGASNYSAVLHSTDFKDAVWTTTVIIVPAVALELVLGLALALWLARPSRGRGLARAVLLTPYLLTPIVIGNFFRMFYSATFGQLNYYVHLLRLGGGNEAWLTDPSAVRPAIIAMEVWHTTPFVMLLCLAGLLAMPRAPIEAAYADGASSWQRLRYVVLPMLAPVLIAIVALRAMDALQLFDEVYVLTGGGPGHLSEVFNLYLYHQGFREFNLGPTSAASMLLVAAVLALGLVAYWARRLGQRLTAAS
jgi:multiple sugar transport system permease protein